MKNQLRNMRSDDLTQVLGIERMAHISPWSRLSFEESLNRNNYCRVLLSEQSVLAYHITSAIADELHILNVVVAVHSQGKGYAHALMQDIFDYATLQTARKILLEVRASNVIAQSLYTAWGFEQLSLRKKYYRATTENSEREDAVVMLRLLK